MTRTLLKIAWESIVRNRVRSLLTMLGVIIGVAAVVITISIGVGARVAVARQITSLGSNLLIVLPGSLNLNGVRTGTGGASTLTADDGLSIARLPHVAAASPLVMVRAQTISGSNNWQTQIVGVAPTFTYIRQWRLASGSSFTDADVASSAKVCVLGKTVVDNLFPDGSSPIGKTITIRNVPFTVIGTLSMRGQSASGQDQDDAVIVPYTSAMERLAGTLSTRYYVNAIGASADAEQNIPLVQNEIVRLLEQRHRIVGNMQDDFDVRNLLDIANAASASATTLEYLLTGVAVVSLVVGGIGIMNIMLVSVTERTREIGLRLAVGARTSAILDQFLIEAVLLASIGGALGVLVGAVGASISANVGHWPMVIPATAVVLAWGSAALTGVFFGYYPASKAAHLNPIEALRFE